MTNETKQYNGMVLLTGYLQRLFVAETIYNRLGEEHDPARLEKVKTMIDATHRIISKFEQTKQLTNEQKNELQTLSKDIEQLMQNYFKPLPLSFNEKLAIAGSALYAEQHVNNGIIRLGEIFNVNVNNDFQQRIKFYEQRTKMIDYLVHTISQNEEPEEQFTKPVDPWFNDVMRGKDHVLNDLKQIGELIGF